MSLTKCIKKAGKALDRDDADAIKALRDGLVSDGIDSKPAGIESVRLHIQDVLAEREAIVEQVEAQGGAAPSSPALQNFDGGTDAGIPDGGSRGPADAQTDEAGGSTAGQADVGNTVPVGSDRGTSDRAEGSAPTDGEAVSGADAAADRQPALIQPTAPIEDFGEKLEGARKDYASKLEAAKHKDTAKVTLAESWPEPDYQRLLDSGVPAESVALIHAMRDEVPAKPRKGWKLRGWVEKLETMRNASSNLIDGTLDAARLKEMIDGNRIVEGVGGRADLYKEFGHGQSLKGITFKKVHWSLYHGEKNVTLWMIDRGSAASAFGNMPRTLAQADTKEGAIEAFRRIHSRLGEEKARGKKAVRFGIYTDRSTKEVFIGKKIGRDVVRVKRDLESVKDAREYMADNQAELESLLEKIKFIPNHRKETNAPRVGANHRNNGDVTPEEFSEAFGFRGVQFGNYVEQGRRQIDLNRAYDALLDLAGILEIPPRALSLNGELGLAFGARGKGGKDAPAAHYESGNVVINLTKREGAGSLAHEWFHALDNYFGRERGGGESERGFVTEGVVAPSTRPEVAEAIKGIIQAVNSTGMRQRSKALDKVRTKAYWSTDVEMAARAFESYVIEKLKDHSASNDYLANIVSEDYWRAAEALGMEEGNSFPYIEAAEVPEIRAAFDKLFQVIESRETDLGDGRTGVELFSRGEAPANAHDTTSLTDSMNRAFPGVFGALEKAGLISVTTSDNVPPWLAFPGGGESRSLAYVVGRQNIVFLADNIPRGTDVKGLMLHEIGVHFRQLGQSDAEFQSILKQFEGLARIPGSKAALAMARVPADTPAHMRAEEGIGYLVENNSTAPIVKRLLDWFRAQLKKWLGGLEGLERTRMMKWANGLSESDLITMATQAVKSAPAAARQAQQGTNEGREAMASAPRDKWYRSALADTVRGMGKIAGKDGMIQPAQAKSWLQSQQKKGAFKQEEMEWSGLSEWLDMQPGKVSVEAISDYMESGGVQVEDVVLGDTSTIEQAFDAEGYSLEFDGDEAIYIDPDGDAVDYSDLPFELRQAVDRASKDGVEPTKYATYTLPGGENYREVLLTLPERSSSVPEFIKEGDEWVAKQYGREIGRSSNMRGLREELGLPQGAASAQGENYRSSHWDQPNVLAHIRMDDRTDANGSRVLFIQELQSDWGQQGRKEGFRQKYKPEDVVSISADSAEAIAPENFWYFKVPGNVLQIPKRLYETEEAARRYVVEEKAAQLGVPTAPFVTNTKAWTSLAMKRIVAYAAENGYDKVAFISGEQAADTFDLSKQVQSIDYLKRDNGEYFVAVDDMRGVPVMEQSLTESELESTFGKDVAKKIVEGGKNGKIEGEGLKVGGEGMKAFYDGIVPQVAKDVLKKFGGGKIESVSVPGGYQGESGAGYRVEVDGEFQDAATLAEAREIADRTDGKITFLRGTLTQPGFTITDAMRQKVQEGLPLFSRQRERQIDTPEFREWYGKSTLLDDNGEPLVMYHGTMSDFSVFQRGRWPGTINDIGSWFASDRETAGVFGSRGQVMPVYLKVENPLYVDSADEITTLWQERAGGDSRLQNGDTDALRDWVRSQGYDGISMSAEDMDGFAKGVYVVPLDPGQIKSAVGNRGTFDPGNPSILFSRAEDSGFGLPDETLTAVAIRTIQDKFKVLKDLQTNIRQSGGQIDEGSDAYVAEELFHGKAENDLRLMRDGYVKPLADKMAKFGVTRAELDEYLYAKHAPERNQHIASINPDMPDGGSGMTDLEAGRVLVKVKKSGKQEQYDQLAAIVYDMTKLQRDLIRQAGLEDDGTIAAWENKYRFYVPLKGWAEDTKDQGIPRTGKGFTIGGKESKRALGRSTEAASPVSYAITDLTEKLIRKRKNEVGNAFLNLVQKNPNKDYWQVFTDENPDTDRRLVKVRDPETGQMVEQVRETTIPMQMMSDRYFTTKKDGKTYFIKLEDPRLMKAMKNLGPETNNGLIRTMSSIIRVMSSLNTSYAPEFVISNFARDIQTAALNLQAEQSLEQGKAAGKKIAAKTVKDTPKAMRAIYASLRGKKLKGKAAKWQELFDQFRADGAKTGWFDMKDLDGQAKDIDRLVGMAKGGAKGTALKFLNASAEVVENLNQSVENAVRLSAYVNAIEAGISRQQAASLAKNMTVNFNRRGEIGTTLNAFYMFANASIQGTANFARTMVTMKDQGKGWGRLNNAQKVAVGIVAGSYFLAMANRMAAGDDDDDENWYDKIPDYVKERNLVIMKSMFGGEQNGEYWKIPLPYGYNVFHVLGDGMEAVLSGNKSAAEAATEMTLATLGSFSPIGFQESNTLGGLLLKNGLPTIAKPIADIGLNENFMGSTIYNENYTFGTPKPNSALGRRSTPAGYQALATWLNEATGGSKYRPGDIDINPDVMRYVIDYFGGSAYSFVGSKVPDVAYRYATGQEVESFRTPFLSRVTGKVLPYEDMDKFYRRRDEVNQLYEELKNTPMADRGAFKDKYEAKLRLQGLIKGSEKQLKFIRQQRDRIYEMDITPADRDKRLKEVERRMKTVVDRFNKAYATAS